MDVPAIEAQPRETGSKAAREVRNNNRVPCVLYGRTVESTPLQIPIAALNKLIYRRSAPVAQVNVDGSTWHCILKDYDLHPLTDRPLHADFQALEEGDEVTLTVPLNYTGIPVGQQNGGDTQQIARELTISVLPENIPSQIEVDISELIIGDSLHVYDLETDYKIKTSNDQTLVTVVAPQIETEPTTEAEEEEDELAEDEIAEEGEAAETEEGEAVEGEDTAAEDGAEEFQ
ncbi:50S ribosomal protein L25 [Salinibacter altiplanensis]|uniref:50S ribosomal protein L25 n=1 Tax=Salinibacter altiplanensis TaxID=1803181 RepID=UPI000C9EF241|nr:50S ribosomal protein L25 [Salinibacter altiplanensis]